MKKNDGKIIAVSKRGEGHSYGPPVKAGTRVRRIGSTDLGTVVMPPTPGWNRYTIEWDDVGACDELAGDLTLDGAE